MQPCSSMVRTICFLFFELIVTSPIAPYAGRVVVDVKLCYQKVGSMVRRIGKISFIGNFDAGEQYLM